MKTQDPSLTRIALPLRALAFLLDFGIFAGLAVALMAGIDVLSFKILGSSGAVFKSSLISFPIFLLYVLYFSSEMMMNKTLGKQLVGIEIRAESGLVAPGDALFRRFVMKHGWTCILFFAYLSSQEVLYWCVYLWFGFLAIGALSSLGKQKQALHDQFTRLAVYPSKVPKADLSQLSKGKSEAEMVAEVQSSAVQLGTSESIKRTAKATLKKQDFPCAVELNIYVKDHETIETQIYECFAQYVPNIHPNQVQLSKKKKGSYRNCRVVMRFDSPLQMERSYAALAKLPNVITTITVRSVKVTDGKGKKSSKSKSNSVDLITAQSTLS